MKPRAPAAMPVAQRQIGGPEDLKALEARMRRDHEPKIMTASLVNYAAAPLGAKKYDSNWLASNTAAR